MPVLGSFVWDDRKELKGIFFETVLRGNAKWQCERLLVHIAEKRWENS